jgi:hypothetical protein
VGQLVSRLGGNGRSGGGGDGRNAEVAGLLGQAFPAFQAEMAEYTAIGAFATRHALVAHSEAVSRREVHRRGAVIAAVGVRGVGHGGSDRARSGGRGNDSSAGRTCARRRGGRRGADRGCRGNLDGGGAVAGVVLDAKFDELRKGAGPGAVLEGPLHLGGEALVQLVPLGTVVPIKVAHQPAECRQVRAELQGPHLEVPRSNPGGVGPVRIVVRLAQHDKKFVKGTEADGTGILAQVVANHIEGVALEATKSITEFGGLRGITMGLRSKLVAQEEDPSTDLIGLRSINSGTFEYPPEPSALPSPPPVLPPAA